MSHELESYAYVISAEDFILAKLEWYRMGGDASGRQGRDGLGVLHVQSGRLDHAHLGEMPAGLGVFDLLGRALEEAAER